MKRKYLMAFSFAAMLSVTLAHPVFAGDWRQDDNGRWYQRTNGTYPVNSWEWIDSDHDGTCECFYFNSNGYCLTNTTTPDGYLVNEQGAWVENGTVQQQALAYDMSVNVTNDVKYNRYSQFDMINRDLSATYLSICDSSGTSLGCSYRPQMVFNAKNEGTSHEKVGVVKLDRNKEYYLEAIISAYTGGDLYLNYPRVASAYAMTSSGFDTVYYDLDINPLKPVNNVKQTLLEDKQIVEGTMSGDVLKNGQKAELRFDTYKFTYTGVCFKSNTFKITDSMPDSGYIEVTPSLYNEYFDSNENIFDDALRIKYVIAGSEKDTTEKVRTDYSKLSKDYDERGINTTVLDMLNSTKEENAAKYTVFASSSSESYDADHPGIVESITYSNHVMIRYTTENKATAAYIRTSSNDDQRSLYKYAPKDSDFPRQGDESDLAEKLNEYAESLGFAYDGYNHVRTDGVKTYNTNPSYGEVYLRFNNEDEISVYISGLGKEKNYMVGIFKPY